LFIFEDFTTPVEDCQVVDGVIDLITGGTDVFCLLTVIGSETTGEGEYSGVVMEEIGNGTWNATSDTPTGD
jgi:hypothetical protein